MAGFLIMPYSQCIPTFVKCEHCFHTVISHYGPHPKKFRPISSKQLNDLKIILVMFFSVAVQDDVHPISSNFCVDPFLYIDPVTLIIINSEYFIQIGTRSKQQKRTRMLCSVLRIQADAAFSQPARSQGMGSEMNKLTCARTPCGNFRSPRSKKAVDLTVL